MEDGLVLLTKMKEKGIKKYAGNIGIWMELIESRKSKSAWGIDTEQSLKAKNKLKGYKSIRQRSNLANYYLLLIIFND